MKKEEPYRKTHSFAFRIEDDVYQKLVAAAERYAVPYTQIHRWALLEFLDEHSDDEQTSRHSPPPPYVPAEQEHGVRIPRLHARKL